MTPYQRITQLEQRLAQLEKRIADLEYDKTLRGPFQPIQQPTFLPTSPVPPWVVTCAANPRIVEEPNAP